MFGGTVRGRVKSHHHLAFGGTSPSSLSGVLSVPAAILMVGQEQRPYLLEEAARQPEPLWCLPRKTRPHGIPRRGQADLDWGPRSKEPGMPEQRQPPVVDTKRAEPCGQPPQTAHANTGQLVNACESEPTQPFRRPHPSTTTLTQYQ